MKREALSYCRVLGWLLLPFAAALVAAKVFNEAPESAWHLLLLTFSFLIGVEVSEAKQELKELREQNAKEAIACPHGHGLCHPFPLGRKPCECGACQIEQPKNDPARSRADG